MEHTQDLYRKSLHTLEFDKIIEQVKQCASSEYARTRIGQLQPCTTLAEAQKAQRETGDAKGLVMRRGTPGFSGLTDVTESVHKAELGAVLSNRQLLEVAVLLRISRTLQDYKLEDETETCLDRYFQNLEPARRLEDRIFDAILNEEEVADSASSALADIRRKMRGAGQKVREVLNRIIHSPTYAKALQEPIVSMRGDRYVIPVKAECRGQVPGLIHDTSSSGQTIFVEPMAVVEANNELRVLVSEEKKEIDRILAELSALVGEQAGPIQNNYRICVYLDFVFAKAVYSRRIQGTAPILNEEGIVDMRRCRHPLLDPDRVVPTDIRLGEEFDTLVITGPNTGGKTVALKTMGLFCAMAAAGLHIPAQEESRVAVFDNIFADIGDEQSIEQSLSTFSSHMTNIVRVMREVDERSLVLFDELGAGTDPVEGAALAVAIIEHIRSIGARVAATTHYSEIKEFALSTPGVENASCEFDVETLRPTYRLLIGIPGKSNAFAISSKLGLPAEIIEAAKAKVNQQNVAFEDILTNLERDRQEMERQRKAAEAASREIQDLRNDLKQQRDHYKQTRENAIRQARLEASRIVEQARYAADKAMEEVEALRKAKIDEETQRRMGNARAMVKSLLKGADDHQKNPDALRPANIPYKKQKLHLGEAVQLLNLNKPATVLTLPDKDGYLTVQAGVMKVRVHEREIRVTEEMTRQQKKEPASAARFIKGSDRSTRKVRTELDLRGQDAQSALMELDKFIDDAVVMGLHQVVIIHGKGTGVLRDAVQQRLRALRPVASFRLGTYGEGENGVTIVELK
ncbi:MAG: endonuclease MutS2 [Eubacteriales bacterium]